MAKILWSYNNLVKKGYKFCLSYYLRVNRWWWRSPIALIFYTFFIIKFWEGPFTHINGIIGINVVNYWDLRVGPWHMGWTTYVCTRRHVHPAVSFTQPVVCSAGIWIISPLSISFFSWFKFYSFHLKFLNNMVVGIILDKEMAFGITVVKRKSISKKLIGQEPCWPIQKR